MNNSRALNPETESAHAGSINRLPCRAGRFTTLVAGGVAIAAAMTGCATADAAPEHTTVATASPEATPQLEPTFDYEDPHEFDLPLDATPEELAAGIARLSTAMEDADLTDETYEAGNTPKYQAMGNIEYAEMVAEKNLTTLYDAQCIPDWRQTESLLRQYKRDVSQNALSVQNLRPKQERVDGVVQDGPAGDSVQISYAVNSVDAEKTADGWALTISMTYHYVGTENDPNVAKLNGAVSVTNWVLTEADGRYLISGIEGVSVDYAND